MYVIYSNRLEDIMFGGYDPTPPSREDPCGGLVGTTAYIRELLEPLTQEGKPVMKGIVSFGGGPTALDEFKEFFARGLKVRNKNREQARNGWGEFTSLNQCTKRNSHVVVKTRVFSLICCASKMIPSLSVHKKRHTHSFSHTNVHVHGFGLQCRYVRVQAKTEMADMSLSWDVTDYKKYGPVDRWIDHHFGKNSNQTDQTNNPPRSAVEGMWITTRAEAEYVNDSGNEPVSGNWPTKTVREPAPTKKEPKKKVSEC